MSESTTNLKPLLLNLPTFTECHLHLDSWMQEKGFLKRILPEFFEKGREHNFDHYLRDHPELNIFHGNEPEEHASRYFEYKPGVLAEIHNLTQKYAEVLYSNGFQGYLEYELVQEYNYQDNFIKPSVDYLIPYDSSTLPKLTYQKTEIGENRVYYEVHYTIPVNLLLINKNLFKKLKLRGVSLDKIDSQGKKLKHAVLTGLFEDVYSALDVFYFLASLNLPIALKLEQKCYIVSPDQKSVMVTVLKLDDDLGKANKQDNLQTQISKIQNG